MVIKINNYCVSFYVLFSVEIMLKLSCFAPNVLILYTQIHLTHVFAHESSFFFFISLDRAHFGSHSISQFSLFYYFFFIPFHIEFILYFLFQLPGFFLMILFGFRKLNFTLDLSNFPPKTFISFIFNFHGTHFILFASLTFTQKMSINEQVLSFRAFLYLLDIIDRIHRMNRLEIL